MVVPVPADPEGGGIREGGGFGGVLANYLPERLRRFPSTITTPQRAIQQTINGQAATNAVSTKKTAAPKKAGVEKAVTPTAERAVPAVKRVASVRRTPSPT